MSESESSENEASDIEEYVSMAYKKFAEDSFAAEAESFENTILSPSTSAPFSSERDNTSPNSNDEAANISRFVNSWFRMLCMNC